MIAAVDLTQFLRDRADHIPEHRQAANGDVIDFGVPRVHYESQDSWTSTVSCSLDWRAEIHLSALDAHGQAPDVVAGYVDFLIVRTGVESVPEVLGLYGPRAATFGELFDEDWLAPDLDDNEDFTAGTPIGTVLLVLDTRLDPAVPDAELRPWAVAEVINTMLPTTSGLVAMTARAASTSGHSRRLVSTDRMDRDWARVGCRAIPGHPGFYGQSTAYVYLDEARTALAHVHDHVFRVRTA